MNQDTRSLQGRSHLSLGLIAAALAGVAFLLVDKASMVDDIAAGFLTFGGVLSGIALFFGWDADVAPDPETLAMTYEENPGLVRGAATAGMLMTIRQNEISLWRKMMLVRCALFVILSATVVGIASKVVKSR